MREQDNWVVSVKVVVNLRTGYGETLKPKRAWFWCPIHDSTGKLENIDIFVFATGSSGAIIINHKDVSPGLPYPSSWRMSQLYTQCWGETTVKSVHPPSHRDPLCHRIDTIRHVSQLRALLPLQHGNLDKCGKYFHYSSDALKADHYDDWK